MVFLFVLAFEGIGPSGIPLIRNAITLGVEPLCLLYFWLT